MKIITNNQKVYDKYHREFKVIIIDCSFVELLLEVRKYIHNGHVLLSHPLSGSIKPGETPYKSVMIEKGDDNFNSETLISDAITMSSRMVNESKKKEYSDKLLNDFSIIDLNIISSAVESHCSFGINA